MIKNEQERQRIGARIAELRKSVEWTDDLGIHRKGMTQKEMAARCGLFQSNLARIESGRYATTVDILSSIADVLGMRIDFVKILCMLMLLSVSAPSLCAKWTLVPRYSSMIMVDEQGDTIDNISSRTTLYKDESSGLFRVAVIHETMTPERVRFIRRSENKASLLTLAAVFGGLSLFSTNDWSSRYKGMSNFYINSTLAGVYKKNANAARTLQIEAWIENTSDEELMIAELERGYVWFLQPGQDIRFTMNNPDLINFRISTPDSSKKHFVTVGGGNFLRDARVEYEDDYIYIFPYYDTSEEGYYDGKYLVMDKLTAEQRTIDKDEMKRIKAGK